MTLWIIEPRDPLIVRDGRPFGPDPGARAATLPFPFPSTIAGALRGLAGRTAEQYFNVSLKDIVREKVLVRGPLLVELDDNGIARWFAPAPADASIHQTGAYEQTQGTLVRFVPATLAGGAVADATDSLLVQTGEPDVQKAHPQAPQFWTWEHFERWLQAPSSGPVDPTTYGIQGLASSARMHVSITPETQTAREGFLYQTRGLEFVTRQRGRLALAAQVEVKPNEHQLFEHFTGGMASLGGERRLMHWEQCETTLPTAPEGLFAQIGNHGACRIVLLTPAHFAANHTPDLAKLADKLHPELVAAAVPRTQVVSGWDMLYQHENGALGAPKPTRRLAPAGAVYFVRFHDDDSPDAIAAWARGLWMRCISEDAQSEHDGFGLAALGAWDGKVQQIGA